ncbi:hypothetical protein FSOLCH5_000993 [Fusarium solani]|uniref:Methyl-CpG-binding domain-containing protein 4 n=1 Tax=Fusarium solani TaxID=169388 RepID=A0A9P9L4M0_FUSSL|nr:uncharacterized protein B0J15DRAFT_478975 [Fusarium solani]KAH7274127.1 hypothetical protein B0J15DRAFT_478975 [Fusarium solani]KAJ3470748.1 hypothetical protein MRS44_000847 [Fusarium solani]KAJ4204188.1 hypothetical protein NW759_014930 [Fusarium solani]
MSDPARSRFGHDVLRTFDAWRDARDFLADVIESSRASSETEELLQQSLVADSEDWHYLIDCAESLRRLRGYDQRSLDGQDVAAYVWRIWNGLEPQTSEPWEATDRLIARAKELERDPKIRPPSSAGLLDNQRQRRCDSEVGLPYSQPPESAKRHLTTSHYWSDQPQDQRPQESHRWSIPTQLPLLNLAQGCVSVASPVTENGNLNYVSNQLYLQSQINNPNGLVQGKCSDQITAPEIWTGLLEDQSLGVKHVSSTSPYFTPPISAPEQKPQAKKRPPRGTISAVPFAPLTSQTFGLIQEVFAHEPFWLLIAVTFLIRTKGLHAIPVFYKFKERFPTPTAVADPANTDELVGMIRHLGLSVHRVALMQKYAQGFLHNPPRAGKTYKVKNYDRRDFDPSATVFQELTSNPSTPSEEDPDEHDLEAWEIGHLTKGKYAIDSWRIFCRDELLGRATDWNGGGREPEFQPEWMRVRPDDKELRAYLRWMWMKEGWEWDPVSGERTVLREEMQRAVNEGRVEYDDTGGLRILDEPRVGWMDSDVLNAGL